MVGETSRERYGGRDKQRAVWWQREKREGYGGRDKQRGVWWQREKREGYGGRERSRDVYGGREKQRKVWGTPHTSLLSPNLCLAPPLPPQSSKW